MGCPRWGGGEYFTLLPLSAQCPGATPLSGLLIECWVGGILLFSIGVGWGGIRQSVKRGKGEEDKRKKGVGGQPSIRNVGIGFREKKTDVVYFIN